MRFRPDFILESSAVVKVWQPLATIRPPRIRAYKHLAELKKKPTGTAATRTALSKVQNVKKREAVRIE